MQVTVSSYSSQKNLSPTALHHKALVIKKKKEEEQVEENTVKLNYYKLINA